LRKDKDDVRPKSAIDRSVRQKPESPVAEKRILNELIEVQSQVKSWLDKMQDFRLKSDSAVTVKKTDTEEWI
jgi:hypothetical protein